MAHLSVRLRITEGGDPPYDHNFLLGSAVYDVLKRYPQLSSAIHASPRRTPYVLSEIYRVTGKNGEYWFRFGASNKNLIELTKKALEDQSTIRIGQTAFAVTATALAEIPCSSGEYLTLSPILLRDKSTGRSLVFDTPGYEDALEKAIQNQILAYLNLKAQTRLIHFEALAVRRRTVNGKTFLAQKGRLLLDGPEQELSFLVDHGIGLSPGMAFGMIIPTETRGFEQ
ncbi:MAG: CRISPR-associated endoribonuclease Cas6 [Thermoplasmata archaeon]